MCLECSGHHRGLGVHISFVRSVTMDSWTDKQVLQMQKGGNDAFRSAFLGAGVPTNLSISEKYNTPQAEAYRQRLMAVIEGRVPSSLPKWNSSTRKSASYPFSTAAYAGEGGDNRGVEALKGESDQQYATRQMKLREEARARMVAKFGGNGMQGIGSEGETRAPHAQSGTLGDLTGALGILTGTVTTAASSAACLVKEGGLGLKVSSGWSYVQSAIQDPALSENVKSSASSGWSVLSSGASSLLQTAQSAVNGGGYAYGNLNGMSSFPHINAELSATGKYAGIGSSHSSTTSSSCDHSNDLWLDPQLSNSSGKTTTDFYMPTQQPKEEQTSSITTNSSSYDPLNPPSSKAFTTGSDFMTSTISVATAPSSVVKKEKAKKDVDFFGEFGF